MWQARIIKDLAKTAAIGGGDNGGGCSSPNIYDDGNVVAFSRSWKLHGSGDPSKVKAPLENNQHERWFFISRIVWKTAKTKVGHFLSRNWTRKTHLNRTFGS